MYRQKVRATPAPVPVAVVCVEGGGHIFALTNRDYSYRLPKKAIQSATRMAIAKRIASEDIVVIDELSFAGP